MRCYGFPEKDAWIYSPKSEGMQYRTHARQWWKRYLHKSARMHAKKEIIAYEKATQEQETLMQDVQASQNGMEQQMENKGVSSKKAV